MIWVFIPCPFFQRFSIQKFQSFSLFSNCSNSVNIWARKGFFFKTGQNFARNWLVMLSVCYTSIYAYFASKTGGVFRGGASGANRCYVMVHYAPHLFRVNGLEINWCKTRHIKLLFVLCLILPIKQGVKSEFYQPYWCGSSRVQSFPSASKQRIKNTGQSAENARRSIVVEGNNFLARSLCQVQILNSK